MQFHCIILWSLLIYIALNVNQIKSQQKYDFHSFQGGIFKIKPPNGVYNIPIGFNSTKTDLIAGFGDFNNDNFNDISTMSVDQKTISLYYWNNDQGIFSKLKEYAQNLTITSILSVDFNNDGFVDLVVTYQNSSSQETFDFIIYLNQKNNTEPYNFNDISTQYIFSGYNIHLSIVDLLGQHRQQILFTNTFGVRTLASYLDDIQTISFLQFSQFFTIPSQIANKQCKSPETLNLGNISRPQFTSFVDINADCMADIIIMSEKRAINDNGQEIVTRFKETYLTQADGSICLIDYQQVSDFFYAITYYDVNQDGAIDQLMLLNGNNNQDTQLQIQYNKLMPNSNNLCQQSLQNQQIYPFDSSSATASNQFQIGTFDSLGTLFSYNNMYTDFPSHLRLGDLYAENQALLMLTFAQTNQNPYTQLFLNTPCDQTASQNNQCVLNANQVYFKLLDSNPQNNNYLSIISQKPSYYSAFFDLGEQGNLDILQVGPDGTWGLYNNLNPDTFFLKAIAYEGGGAFHGASFQCLVTQLEGTTSVATQAQLWQSGNFGLSPHFAFFGLGRTNNYVEQFTLGLPTKGAHSRSWTPIIPNSQLILNPDTVDPSGWKITIYVNPTQATIIILIATVILLIVLGIIIFVLHQKEKQQDRKTQDAFVELFR